jgi:hypothetical protein
VTYSSLIDLSRRLRIIVPNSSAFSSPFRQFLSKPALVCDALQQMIERVQRSSARQWLCERGLSRQTCMSLANCPGSGSNECSTFALDFISCLKRLMKCKRLVQHPIIGMRITCLVQDLIIFGLCASIRRHGENAVSWRWKIHRDLENNRSWHVNHDHSKSVPV